MTDFEDETMKQVHDIDFEEETMKWVHDTHFEDATNETGTL